MERGSCCLGELSTIVLRNTHKRARLIDISRVPSLPAPLIQDLLTLRWSRVRLLMILTFEIDNLLLGRRVCKEGGVGGGGNGLL